MLDAPEAFFFRRGYDLTIAEQTGRRIAMIGVETEKKQKTLSFQPRLRAFTPKGRKLNRVREHWPELSIWPSRARVGVEVKLPGLGHRRFL